MTTVTEDRALASVDVDVVCRAAAMLTEIGLRKPVDSPHTVKLWQLVLDLDQNSAEAYNGLGLFAVRQRDWAAAVSHFEECVSISRSALALLNLSIAEDHLGHVRIAASLCQAAIDTDPKLARAYGHLYTLHDQLGELDLARKVLLKGLEECPGAPEILFALAELDLKEGHFDEGWKNYEYRNTLLKLRRDMDEFQEWTRQPIEGKTILVMRDQGLGDDIMFSRYLWWLKREGAKVRVFTHPGLARLFALNFPFADILTVESQIETDFDYWVASGSLAGNFYNCENIAPPFKAPATSRGAECIKPGENLKVGLRWAGNPNQNRERHRGMPFDSLKPLLDIPGIDFYSLQDGAAALQNTVIPNLAHYEHDTADLAATIDRLDLVISVDTMVAHLAGAMGKPTWILLPGQADWRWGACNKTAWYPSVNLARGESCIVYSLAELSCLKNSPITRRAERTEWFFLFDGVQDTPFHQCRYGIMRWHANSAYVGRALDLYGEYSQSEIDLLSYVLRPGDVTLEAGANIGAHTSAIAHLVGLHAIGQQIGRVLAFEPQKEYFDLLAVNSPGNVFSSNLALGETAGTINVERAELEKTHAPSWFGAEKPNTVECVTIDSLKLERLNLIKIDVDGLEHAILRGAEQTIGRCRPFLYIEHDKPECYPDMIPWLEAHDYRIYQHDAPMFNPHNFRGNHVNVFGNIVSRMLLCIPNERKDLHPAEWGITGISRVKVKR